MVRPASRWAPRPHSGVAGFPWNQWQLCYGISGNFRVEQVAALAWNRWQDSPGISGSFGVEYAEGDAASPVKPDRDVSAYGIDPYDDALDAGRFQVRGAWRKARRRCSSLALARITHCPERWSCRARRCPLRSQA